MTPSPPPFDLLVLGAGSGGLATAKRAASYGKRVAIVEESRVGGTCVIRGCIPKKLMVYAANLGAGRELAEAYGWNAPQSPIDFGRLKTFRDATVTRLEALHERALETAGVTLLRGAARILSPTEVEVDGQTHRANKLLIATGATPQIPTFPGAAGALSSDDFWDLAHCPKKAVLVGGGYIAVEFASILAGLGCHTTLVVRSTVLREFDSSLGAHLTEALVAQGVTVHSGASVTALSEGGPDQPRVLSFRDAEGEERRCATDACVLFATGRSPNTAHLNLETAGVHTTESGAIEVNHEHRTSCPTVFAVGDVTGQAQLTPVAIKAGREVADREFGNLPGSMSYENIPTAIFSRPPVGTVGLSEEQARERYGDDVKVYQARFNPLLYSPLPPEKKVPTLMKLVVRPSNDRVLGFHMVGDDAPEIIQGFAAALKAGVTKTQLDSTVAIHPSAAEEFVLMR